MKMNLLKRMTALCLCVSLTFGCFAYPVFAEGSGRSLQTRSADMIKGMFLIPIEQELGESYYVNFDYRVPSGEFLNRNQLWASCESLSNITAIGPSIIQGTVRVEPDNRVTQVDEKLTVVYGNTSIPLDVELERDMWYTITLHYFGERFGLYIDGERIPLSADKDGYLALGKHIKIPSFGQVGDTNWRKPPAQLPKDSTCGITLYDNISIVSEGNFTSYTFDDGAQGVRSSWQKSGGDVVFDQPVFSDMNSEPTQIQTISATASGTDLKAGDMVLLHQYFTATGTLARGNALISGMAVFTASSDAPDVIDVITLNGSSYLYAKKAGSASIDLSVNYLGSVVNLDPITVVAEKNESKLSNIRIENSITTLGTNQTLQLELSAERDGAWFSVIPANSEGFSVESSNPAVLRVTSEGDAFSVHGVSEGAADITFTYNQGDIPMTVTKPFSVADGNAILTQQFDMDAIRERIGKPNAKLRPTLGTFWIPVENPEGLSESYTVSFDYYYPSRDSKYKQSNFLIWSSLENTAWDTSKKMFPTQSSSGPAIIQTGERVVIGHVDFTERELKINQAVLLTESLSSDAWHHFTIHYTPEGMGVYLNGKLSPSGYYDTNERVVIRNLGPFGDPLWPDAAKSATASSGWAYYDNLTLASDDSVIAYSFNDGEQGIIRAQNAAANDDASMFVANDTLTNQAIFVPEMNVAPARFASFQAIAVQSGYSMGMEESAQNAILLEGFMSDGTLAPSHAGSLQYTSSDSSIIRISGEGNSAVLHFDAPGNATITVACTINGVTLTADVSLEVVAEKQVVGITITAPDATLLVNQEKLLEVSARYSDKTLAALSAEILAGLTIQSSSPSVVSVEGSKLRPLSAGSARITVTGEIDGRPYETHKQFQVASIEQLTVNALSAHVFAGDSVPIQAIALMSNGEYADMSEKVQLTLSHGSAEGVDIRPEADTFHVTFTEEGSYTIEAALNGKTATLSVEVLPLEAVKTKSSYYTKAKRNTAQENIETLSWAADVKRSTLDKAEQWLSSYDSLDEIRSIIPSQGVGRTFAVNSQLGCLICGKAIDAHGNYPYSFETDTVDWKLTCPSCGISFPTNDFASYYRGGLNAVGDFDPVLAKMHNDDLIARGESGNLVNLYSVNGLTAEQKNRILQARTSANAAQIDAAVISLENNPDFGVDDGMGYRFNPDDKSQYGNPYTYVGYYAHFALWRGGIIEQMLRDFSDAYMYTSLSANPNEQQRSQAYADAALILLDRIADVYPAMHVSEYPHNGYYGFTNSDGHHTVKSRGRTLGSIWENDLAKNILYAYDAVYPGIPTMSDEAKAVLTNGSRNAQKADPVRLRANFEHGFIREIHQAFRDGDLEGNPGMMQSTLALAAVVLDHNPETMDWLNLDFRSGNSGWKAEGERTGGNVMEILVNGVDRDGQGDEVALGYNALWLDNWLVVAQVLDGYQLPGGGELDGGIDADLFQNVRFRQLFHANYPLLLTSNYTPNIGDTGKTGGTTPGIINMEHLLLGYHKYGTDELAQAIYLLNGKSSAGLSLDIFSKNPNAVATAIDHVIARKGELDLGSTNKSGYGIGILRDGQDLSSSSYKGISYGFLDLDSHYSDGLIANRNYPPAIQVEPKAVGQEISFDFSLSEEPGQYQLYLELRAVDGWAKYDIKINGQKVGAYDFDYGVTGQGDNLTVKIADVPLRSGGNTITFTCAEAGAGGSLKMALRYLYLLEPGKDMPKDETAVTTQRALWLFYGNRSASHNHADPLNLGYIAYDLDFMPDFGYPNTLSGSQSPEQKWDKSTPAHNTVSFDALGYDGHVVGTGKIRRFDSSPYVQVMNAGVDQVTNSGTNYASQYDRTSALIRIDEANSYIVDLFHVTGINGKYQYNFHTAEVNPKDTVYSGLSLTGSPTTYNTNTLRNVIEGSANRQGFSIDWRIRDTWNRYLKGAHADTDVRMKITMLGQYEKVRVGEAVPPTNVVGNAPWLPVLMVTGSGKTTFVSVMEAYQGTSQIVDIEEIPVTLEAGGSADPQVVRAIRVTLSDGRTDTIIHSLDDTTKYIVDGQLHFSGFFGVYTEKDGTFVRSYLHDGTRLGEHNGQKEVAGTVLGSTTSLQTSNHVDIRVTETISAADLVGKYLYVDNDDLTPTASVRLFNAVYLVEQAENLSQNVLRLHLGSQSVVRGWKNPKNLNDGYALDFRAGASCRIPLTTVKRSVADAYAQLTEYCNEVRSVDPERYTPLSWERFSRILERAEQLLEQQSTDVDSLETILRELKEAFHSLVDLPTDNGGEGENSGAGTSAPELSPVILNGDNGVCVEIPHKFLPRDVTPSDLRLVVKPIASSERVSSILQAHAELPKVNNIVLYDVQIVDSSGNPVAFSGAVTVRIPLPAGMGRLARVFFYDEDRDVLAEVPALLQENTLEIRTTHFSYYAVVEFASPAGTLPKVLTLDPTKAEEETSALIEADVGKESQNPKTGHTIPVACIYFLTVLGCVTGLLFKKNHTEKSARL